MAKHDYPMTRGVRLLQSKKVVFEPYLYSYEEHGGTAHAAAYLEVDEYAVIKTLVMAPSEGKPFLVLMHGDREASTKNLARVLGVKSVSPCNIETAERVTGYQVGGISPFGTRQTLQVYVERTILSLDRFYINGGKRGFLIAITPSDLRKALNIHEVEVAVTL